MYDLIYKIEKNFNKLKEKEIILISLLPGVLLGFIFYQYVYTKKIKIFKKKEKEIKVLKNQINDFKSQNMIITSSIQEIEKLNSQVKEYNKKILKFVKKTKNNIYYLKSDNIFKINWVNVLSDINKYLKENNIKLNNFSIYLNENGELKEQEKMNKKCTRNSCKKITRRNGDVYSFIKDINKKLTNKLLLLKPKYYYYYELNVPDNISDLLSFINQLFNDRKMKQIYLIDFNNEFLKNKTEKETKNSKNIENKNAKNNNKKQLLKLLIIYFDIKK